MRQLFILFTFLVAIGIQAQTPGCTEACEKYYTCVQEKLSTLKEDQKQMFKKGCNDACAKPKYFNDIVGCYNQKGSDCSAYNQCIITAVQKAVDKK
jgi:Cys-rich protein (TIGR04453 family)